MPTASTGSYLRLMVFVYFAFISTIMAEVVTMSSYKNLAALVPDPTSPRRWKPAQHDVYYRHKCYCIRNSLNNRETPSDAAYFNIEYFNHRHQIYFSLEFNCTQFSEIGQHQNDECSPLPKSKWSGLAWADSGNSYYQGCVSDGSPNNKPWCYKAARNFGADDKSWITSKIEAKLNSRGRALLESQSAVNFECERLCKEKISPGLTVSTLGSSLAANTIDFFDEGWDFSLYDDKYGPP